MRGPSRDETFNRNDPSRLFQMTGLAIAIRDRQSLVTHDVIQCSIHHMSQLGFLGVLSLPGSRLRRHWAQYSSACMCIPTTPEGIGMVAIKNRNSDGIREEGTNEPSKLSTFNAQGFHILEYNGLSLSRCGNSNAQVGNVAKRRHGIRSPGGVPTISQPRSASRRDRDEGCGES